MSILRLEPFVFPADLLTESSAGATESIRWWVLHTRPRAEKALARALTARSVPFFLPLARSCRSRRGGVVQSFLPLFPGYVFLFADERQRIQALETNRVVTTMRVEDQMRLHDDLCRLFCLIAAGAPLTPEQRLGPGMPVEITTGYFAGLRGRIIRRANQLRLVVEVDFLQRGASVEIDESMIVPVTPLQPLRRLSA